MITITTLVIYRRRRAPPAPKTRAERVQSKRDGWRAEGLCLQCGGERPCAKHAAAAAAYRRGRK